MPTNFEFIFHANRGQISSELISKQICFQICQTQLNILTNKAKKNEIFVLFFINSF